MAQLAAMGVAVPEDFRREMAMAGDWQTLSERAIYSEDVKKEDDEDVKPNNLNIGVRKRKFKGQEEEEEAGHPVVRRGWGSTARIYPDDTDDDLDTLLQRTKILRRRDGASRDAGSGDAKESPADLPERPKFGVGGMEESRPEASAIKKEESAWSGPDLAAATEYGLSDSPVVKTEDDPNDSGMVFKKRKPKHIRQK